MASTSKSYFQEKDIVAITPLLQSDTSSSTDGTSTDDDPDQDTHPAFRLDVPLSRLNILNLRIGCSAPALIDISRICYSFLSKNDNNIQAIFSPECLDYYVTAMLWFRFITLKHKLRQKLTGTECTIFDVLLTYDSFSIPEPILMQLRIFGSLNTPNGDFIEPIIPNLPDKIINGFGGYYGLITEDTHNFYEEIPCLGVLAEAVRHSASDFTFSYISSLDTSECSVNDNLLGFKSLGPQSHQSKEILNELYITRESFPEFPKGTGLNMGLIYHVSTYLAQSTTFKVRTLTLTSLSKTGSLAQVTTQHVISTKSILEKHDNISVSSLFNGYNSVYGLAIVYIPQLMKGISMQSPDKVWCCVNTPVGSWIDNRNDRRTKILHRRYTDKVFSFEECNANIFRLNAIQQMVISDK